MAKKNQKTRKGKTAQNGSKGVKEHKFYIPVGEILEIQSEWLSTKGAGHSIRAIAKKFGRDPRAVTRIVNCPDVISTADAMKKKLMTSLGDLVTDRIAAEIKDKKSPIGAAWAMSVAERWGVLPKEITEKMMVAQLLRRKEMEGTTPANADDDYNKLPEEKRMKYWVEQLTAVAVERGKVFGMPMPELDELAKEIDIPIPDKKEKVKA